MIKYHVKIVTLNMENENIEHIVYTADAKRTYPAVTSKDYFDMINGVLSEDGKTIESQPITELHIKFIETI